MTRYVITLFSCSVWYSGRIRLYFKFDLELCMNEVWIRSYYISSFFNIQEIMWLNLKHKERQLAWKLRVYGSLKKHPKGEGVCQIGGLRRRGIVRERVSTARGRFFTDCGRICRNLYVEAKNFGFIHILWNPSLIMSLRTLKYW